LTGHPFLKIIVSNWQGGLIGIVVFLLLWALVFFIAFMTAFGNDMSEAQIILQGASVFAAVANPLWGIPLSYCAGAVGVRKSKGLK
jgi:hypothetical protein